MKLYFVRHGESEANVRRVISNRQIQHALTEKGRQQAAILAQHFAGCEIQKIYTSPVPRAVQTAEILAGELGVPHEITDSLREFDCGIAEGRADEDAWNLHGGIMAAWLERQEYDRRIEGGESFNDIRQRFVPFIEGLVSEHGAEPGGIVLVGHGGTFYCMLPLILNNIDSRFIAEHGIDHTRPIIVEQQSGGLVCTVYHNILLE